LTAVKNSTIVSRNGSHCLDLRISGFKWPRRT